MSKSLIKSWIKRLVTGICALVVILWLSDKMFPLHLTRYQDKSTIIYGAHQEYLHVFLTQDDKFRLPMTQNEIPTLYVKTLLTKEDRFYLKHFGVNPFSIFRAFYYNVRANRIMAGGSTLTMQTARLLEPRRRTFMAKIIECFRALQLEWHFSKAEILNIYLTLAPFGGNIEGVKAAAWTYFHKAPQSLNAPEIALLVAMVQSPNGLQPNHYPHKAQQARNHVLHLMKTYTLITPSEYELHRQAPIPKKTFKFPREIPHLAWRLKQQNPATSEIQSTIELPLQKQIEQLLQKHRYFLPPRANVAILVLDHVQNKPVAYLGSLDFFDSTHHGFVDYIKAYRSPGSTLKPFIYGVAFDSGLIQPENFLLDVRRRFGAYYPRNFDKDIHGMVQAKEALALSLNIPAVEILDKIGVVRFISFLKESGVTPKLPRFESPGLSSALGGLGISLEQLVLLYSGLANQGKIKSFSYIDSLEPLNENYFLSARAAQHVTDILAVENPSGQLISMKTGTSYGHRDALAIGYDKQYVVGIWIGLPNGAPMRAASGATVAVPLLQKIFPLMPRSTAMARNIAPPQTHNGFMLKLLTQSSHDPIKSQDEALTLLFPVDNTLLTLEQLGPAKTIPCSVRGGVRPYTWLIDAKPVATQRWQQKYLWQPEQPGYYTITVIDAAGKRVQAVVEIS